VEHLQADAKRSVRVVAFSVSQADAILDELESLRRDRPELDSRFGGDRLDGVFVKMASVLNEGRRSSALG